MFYTYLYVNEHIILWFTIILTDTMIRAIDCRMTTFLTKYKKPLCLTYSIFCPSLCCSPYSQEQAIMRRMVLSQCYQVPDLMRIYLCKQMCEVFWFNQALRERSAL